MKRFLTLFLCFALMLGNAPVLASDSPSGIQSAIYALSSSWDGLAGGTVTIDLAEPVTADQIAMYWGTAEGILPGYSPIAPFDITDTHMVYEMEPSLMIPSGTTCLMIFTVTEGVLSKDFYTISLPDNAAYTDPGDPLFEFQVVSDTHIQKGSAGSSVYNSHFVSMLSDVAQESPNSCGLVIVGDITDGGLTSQYAVLESLYRSVSGVPPLFTCIGNHDAIYPRPYSEAVRLYTSVGTLPEGGHPEGAYYDFWLNGYHFVFLGSESYPDSRYGTSYLSDTQLEWLRETLSEDRDENRPTFVFHHQGFNNTVAGTRNNLGALNIDDEERLRDVLQDFPEVMFFSGHSHWSLNSGLTVQNRSATLPTLVNTASCAYLWYSGGFTQESHGLYLRVYEDRVQVLGRDFVNGRWISSAQYSIDYADHFGVFRDIPSDSWYETAVYDAVQRGIISGTSETTFDPDEPMTRAMFSASLYRIAGSPETPVSTAFSDVDSYYLDAVNWAVSTGILPAESEDTFSPDASVSREELSAILYRFASVLGCETDTAADLSACDDYMLISQDHLYTMSWSCAANLLSAEETGGLMQLNPGGTVSRASATAILMRFIMYVLNS